MPFLSPSTHVAADDAAVTVPMHVPLRLLTALRVLAVCLSGFLVLLFVSAFRRRLHFPFELDWIEDGIVASVRHVRAGLPIYSAPSVDYTPYLYTPLYVYAAALVSRLTGVGYVPLRIVSFVATFGCFAAIFGLVYSEVRRYAAGIVAVGCFAACYPLVYDWFDLGRVDMLSLCFLLAALWATRSGRTAIAILLWVCAFQTKQGILPIALLALCHDWHRPRRAIAGVLGFVLTLGVSILFLNHLSHGWYRFYVFSLGGALLWDTTLFTHYWTTDILLPFGMGVVVVALATVIDKPRWRTTAASFYVCNSLSIFLFTWFIRGHLGSSLNALLPVYAWLAVLLGVSLGRAERMEALSESALARPALAALWLAAAFQLAMHVYGPRVQAPGAEILAERQAFEEQIRSIPGDVLLVNFPERGRLADKPVHASGEATGLVIDTWGPEGRNLLAAYHAKFVDHAYTAVVLDRSVEQLLPLRHPIVREDFTKLYPLRVSPVEQETTLGRAHELQPKFIYFPCSQIETATRLDPNMSATFADRCK